MERDYPKETTRKNDSEENQQSASHIPFSIEEARACMERLQVDETFCSAAETFMTWLQQGEFRNKNSEIFHPIMNIIRRRSRELQNEKLLIDKTIKEKENRLLHYTARSCEGLEGLERLLEVASSRPEFMENLSEAQRKEFFEMKERNREESENFLRELMFSDVVNKMAGVSTEQDRLVSNPQVMAQGSNDMFPVASISSELQDMLDTVNDLKHQSNALQQEVRDLELRNEQCRSSDTMTEEDINLSCRITPFLYRKQDGASIDEICSFFSNILPDADLKKIEPFMKSHPSLFKEETTGIGATLTKKWKLNFEVPEIEGTMK